jgi:hypothetical protein
LLLFWLLHSIGGFVTAVSGQHIGSYFQGSGSLGPNIRTNQPTLCNNPEEQRLNEVLVELVFQTKNTDVNVQC